MLDIFTCACCISLEKWRSDHFYEAILCPQDDTLERKGWRGSDLLPQRKFHHFTFTTYLFFPKELSCSPLWINNIWKFLCVMRIKKGHHIVSMCHFSPLSSPPPPRSPNSWVSFQESVCQLLSWAPLAQRLRRGGLSWRNRNEWQDDTNNCNLLAERKKK